MPFASINSTNPKDQALKIFAKFFWEFAVLKISVFWVRDFEENSKKKNFFFHIFFCFIPIKISPNLYGRMDGSKFWCFRWFPENTLLCVQCTCGISCPLLKSNSFMDNSYMHIRKKQIFLMKTEFFNENRFFQIDFLTLHELFERVVSCWIS